MAPPLLDQILEAHGGLDRWRRVERIEVRIRTGGLLPRTRFPGGALADFSVAVEPARGVAIMRDFDRRGVEATFERGSVSLREGGRVVAERPRPRELFSGRSGLRRNLRWDRLDTAYFGGYAIWNYLSTPLLLCSEGIEVTTGPEADIGGERLSALDVSFPAGIHTHCREQRFWFDVERRLRRHDYTADVIGGWARAAHLCERHRRCEGLLFPTRRRVRPRLGRRALPVPTLVALDLEAIEVAGPG